MDISELLTTALAILTLAFGAGLGFMRGTVTNLRGRLDDADKAVARSDRELAKCQLAQAEDHATIASLQAKVAMLEGVVRHDEQWQTLIDLVSTHHAAAETWWANIDRRLPKERT